MNRAEVRTYCLSLTEAIEDFPFGENINVNWGCIANHSYD
jgi:hypothetical protein